MVILGFLAIFLGIPLGRYSRKIAGVFYTKQKELSNARRMVRLNPNPQKGIDKIRKGMNQLRNRAVSQKDLPQIIQQLVRKSSELDIEIVSIKPKENIKVRGRELPQGVSKAYIEMIIKCPYDVLGNYLKAISRLPIIFTIESIYIEKIEQIAQKPEIKRKAKKQNYIFATLILSTYAIWKI